jgi:phosphopantetheinyl transferase
VIASDCFCLGHFDSSRTTPINVDNAYRTPQPELSALLECGGEVSNNKEIAVWYRHTESLTVDDLESADTVLCDEERERRDRFVFAEDRRDFAAAHALLRNALSTCEAIAPAEWRFERNGFGKPRIVADQVGRSSLTFNLSHTRGLVVCAIGRDVALGVDAERRDRGTAAAEIARQYFAPREIAELGATADAEYAMRFVEIWTLKEAYIKAIGKGLSLPLRSFAFGFEGTGGLCFESLDDQGWQFWLAAVSREARIAVAARQAPQNRTLRISFHDVAGHASARLLRSFPCSAPTAAVV